MLYTKITLLIGYLILLIMYNRIFRNIYIKTIFYIILVEVFFTINNRVLEFYQNIWSPLASIAFCIIGLYVFFNTFENKYQKMKEDDKDD